MDPAKLVVVLEGTINPTLRKDAESKLEEVRALKKTKLANWFLQKKRCRAAG